MQGQLNRAFSLVSQNNTEAIKEGERLLSHFKKNSQYPLALLNYIQNTNNDVCQLRAAIEIKLWCQYFKNLQEFEQDHYYQGHLQNIKQQILLAYFNFPLKISKTLRPGIVALTDSLFPKRWPELISGLISYARQNPHSIIAVLKIIQSVSFKSDPLYEEIILVCDQAHDFLLELTMSLIGQIQNGREEDVVMLRVLMQIYYNLNFQDLHPKFEDNLEQWMSVLKAVMSLPNSNESMFKCKGAVLEAVLLYASKYKEDVEKCIQGFCSQIWQMCASASQDPELDTIVFSGLKFFKSLVLWPEMMSFFKENMGELFTNLIIPNIGINSAHVALFQDQIDLYIDYYFRNAEIQTRRAAALELLRVICRRYDFVDPFLQQQLQNFSGVAGDVKAECMILSLVIDASTKGFRDIDGCTQLFVREEIIQYAYQQVVKKTLFKIYDWMGKNQNNNIESTFNTIHITTIIRFLFYFRIFIPKEELPLIVQFLTSVKTDNSSLLKVIYLSINGFLHTRHGDFVYFKNLVYFFRGDTLKNNAVDILRLIYNGTTREKELQQSLTKMFYNITKNLVQSNQEFFEYEIEIVKEMLSRTKVYNFNTVQFLFEAIGEMAFHLISCKSNNRNDLEKIMMNFFLESLNNKSDLLNFCLQILSIFLQLEENPNPQYLRIYNSLLMTENWKEENQSLMSSYIQFLISFIARNRQRLVQDKAAVQNILSEIIKLDLIELFYRFMEAITNNISLQQFHQSGYLSLVLQAGTATGHTIAGRKAGLLFICKILMNYNTADTLKVLNDQYMGYFDQLLEASPDILKSLSHRGERKFLFGAICSAINLNYFQNMKILSLLFNCLVQNTIERFSFRNISNQVSEYQAKQKKESTYKKLLVFKDFEKNSGQIEINEELEVINCFRNISKVFPDLVNVIDDKNKNRLIKLNDKYPA